MQTIRAHRSAPALHLAANRHSSPGAACATRLTSVALRTASGLRRRSSPFSSIRSKEEDAVAMPPFAHPLKAGDAVVAAGDRLAVDDAGACAQMGERAYGPTV
jgi:hypothetical protein